MRLRDLLILSAVFIPALFAVRFMWRRRGRGCGGSCAACHAACKTKTGGRPHAHTP